MSDAYWSAGQDFQTQLLKWERVVEEYQKSSGRDFPEEVSLAAQPSGDPHTHLLIRATGATTYDQARALVVEYLQKSRIWSEQFAGSRAGDPMKVGQAKGKAKGSTCNKCGKKGHVARDCRSQFKGEGTTGAKHQRTSREGQS